MDSVGNDHHSGELVVHTHAIAVRVRGVSPRESAEGESMDEHMKMVRWMMSHGATAEEIQRYVSLAEGTASETTTTATTFAKPARCKMYKFGEAFAALRDIVRELGEASVSEIALRMYQSDDIRSKDRAGALLSLHTSKGVFKRRRVEMVKNGRTVFITMYSLAKTDSPTVSIEGARARMLSLVAKGVATIKDLAPVMYPEKPIVRARNSTNAVVKSACISGFVTMRRAGGNINRFGALIELTALGLAEVQKHAKRDDNESAPRPVSKTDSGDVSMVEAVMRSAILRAITAGNNSITSITRAAYGDELPEHIEAMTTTLDALEHEGVLRSHAGKGGNSYTLA